MINLRKIKPRTVKLRAIKLRMIKSPMLRSPVIKLIALAAIAAASAAPANASVVSAGDAGFNVTETVSVSATPMQAYRNFLNVAAWWSSEHTFSHDARNLSLKPRPGGCFCETLKNGGFVRHMETVYAAPGDALVLSGGLGPLQSLGAGGAMTIKFSADAAGTKVTLNYIAGGYAPKGWTGLAPIVDAVLGEQMARYAAFAAGRKP